ncbi:hypothetical protein ABZ208_37875 [Streptomyces sp. NPDC006208]|uniref:hypothetical protein n=1 Tax=Streptomyces sp. NPDC006208 TaxID=3156734 RepID=UPI0033B7B6B4
MTHQDPGAPTATAVASPHATAPPHSPLAALPDGIHHCGARRAAGRRSPRRLPGAALLLGLLVVVDAGNGTLSGGRSALWAGLSVVLFVVLLPARVTAGRGWIHSRGVLVAQHVRTDRLVCADRSDGVAQRLLLRDADGRTLRLDPRVLVADPRLWHLPAAGIRVSRDIGTLRYGGTALHELSARIDDDTAEVIFRISGPDT